MLTFSKPISPCSTQTSRDLGLRLMVSGCQFPTKLEPSPLPLSTFTLSPLLASSEHYYYLLHKATSHGLPSFFFLFFSHVCCFSLLLLKMHFLTVCFPHSPCIVNFRPPHIVNPSSPLSRLFWCCAHCFVLTKHNFSVHTDFEKKFFSFLTTLVLVKCHQ